MVKILIHLSDLHIRTLQLHDHHTRQFKIFLEDVKKHIEGYEYEEIRFVITGDIAHQKITISNEQLILTSWFFTEISKLGKLIIIPGNHDFLENNLDRLDTITPIIELLNNDNIVYYKDSGVYDDDSLKWVVYSLFQHNQRPDFKKEKKFLYVGLFHGPIQELSTDLGYKFEESYDRLNFLGLDLLLCGDVHKRQKFKLPDGGEGIMIGSFAQDSFGETVKHHGYGVYDIEDKEYTFHDLPNEQPYLHFKITDIKDIENGTEELINFG
jgi:DNA repair exonuclease SbcCD nuclease subunit